MVLDQGRVMEFDPPQRLLKQKESLFSELLTELKTKEEKKRVNNK